MSLPSSSSSTGTPLTKARRSVTWQRYTLSLIVVKDFDSARPVFTALVQSWTGVKATLEIERERRLPSLIPESRSGMSRERTEINL